LRWGLIPNWAKDPKIAYKTINARVETIDTTLTFHKITPGEGAGARFEQLDSH